MFLQSCIIVTGAAGFVGSHLVEALLNQADDSQLIIGVDNFLTGRQENLDQLAKHSKADKQFSFLQADVTAPAKTYLQPLFNELLENGTLANDFSIQAIYHLASPASPPRYQEHPVETYQVNAFATHELLNYLKENFPKSRFIFASTSEVYGDPEIHPQPETYWGMVNPNGVRSCYDEAKRLGESICGVFERDFGLDVRIMRIFNTYGPRMDPDDGRVIPNFIKQSIKGDPITIYGSGNQTRSYCFVSDLVAGIVKLGAAVGVSGQLLKGATINLGNPDEYSIQETAEIIYEAVHSQPLTEEMYEFKELPGDDPTRRKPDITRAQEMLGWQPTVSLIEGLQKTVAYFVEIEGIERHT
jgi:nucleoside-diphosphate-sugar epimerase